MGLEEEVEKELMVVAQENVPSTYDDFTASIFCDASFRPKLKNPVDSNLYGILRWISSITI